MVDRGSLFIVYGFTVFSMQAGFSMLEAGAVRAKNMKHILLKNVLDTCFGFMCWFLAGWAISSGSEGSSLFGTNEFFLMDTTRYDLCFFSYGFAATSATIISGAVAERIRLESYLAFVCIMIVFIYAPIAYWVWSPKGWLRFGMHFGIIDWAGSGVVHLVGGLSGLVGIKFIGPRMGRFTQGLLDEEMIEVPRTGRARIVTFDIPEDDVSDSDISWKYGQDDYIIPMNVVGLTGNTEVLQVLGTFLIWIGWFPFNVGMVAAHGYGSNEPLNTSLEGMIAVNTLISSCASCITVAAIIHYREGIWLTSKVCNSILSGAVAITAGCATMEPSFALLCGSFGGIIYYLGSHFLITHQIDDPLEASCVHGVSGLWGLIAAGLFSDPDLIKQAYSDFYTGEKFPEVSRGMQFLKQIFGILTIIVYVLTLSTGGFMLVHRLLGLRIRKTLEQRGLNQQFHDDGYIAFSKEKRGYKIDFHVPSSDHYPISWTKADLKAETSISRSRTPTNVEMEMASIITE